MLAAVRLQVCPLLTPASRPMVDLLVDSPVLLLVVVAALGYGLGQIKVKGSGLGVAAVLFAGLAVGALDPEIGLPPFAVELGLALFVYTIGLSSGLMPGEWSQRPSLLSWSGAQCAPCTRHGRG